MSNSVAYYCYSGRRSKLQSERNNITILLGSLVTFFPCILECRPVPKHLGLLFMSMVGWEKKEGTTLEATIASDLLLTVAMLSANTITIQNKVVIYSFRIFVLENPRDEPVQSTSINLWTTNQEHKSALMSNQTKPNF